MIIQPVSRAAMRHLSAAAVFLGLACSCRQPTADPKGVLIASLKGAEAGGYLFALKEDEAQTTTSLTNRIVNQPVIPGKDDTDLILRYTRIEDHKTRTAKTYKSEVLKKNSSLTLLITDLESGAVVEKNETSRLPINDSICDGQEKFDTIAACQARFSCSSRGLMQCEANRTCKTQIGELLCCLKNGNGGGAELLLIASPNSVRCSLRATMSDINDLVFRPN